MGTTTGKQGVRDGQLIHSVCNRRVLWTAAHATCASAYVAKCSSILPRSLLLHFPFSFYDRRVPHGPRLFSLFLLLMARAAALRPQ